MLPLLSALNSRSLSTVPPFPWGALIGLAALLALPTAAVIRLFPTTLAETVGGWVVAVSLFACFVYSNDKRRAQQGEWRTPESMLHFLELIGGWPGAWLSRRWLRHKSSKLSFLVQSWGIIGLYQLVAIDALLDWRFARAAWSWVGRS